MALEIDDLIFYCAIGVILGGRLGWCIFYGHDVIAESWLNVFHIWDGGMSFHGGMTGVLVAGIVFARVKHKRSPMCWISSRRCPALGCSSAGWEISSMANCGANRPICPGDSACRMRSGVLISRHPSQLYEATLEGLVLFLILLWYTSKPRPRLAPTGLFLLLYGCGRFMVEWVRLPDANIGYLVGDWLTMGMLLTTPMIVIGAAHHALCLPAQRTDRQFESP